MALKNKIIWWAVGFISLAALVVCAILYGPWLVNWFIETFKPESVQAFLEHTGPLAPVAFILMVAAQVIVAPIPMQVLGFAGGYMFGVWTGTVYGLIGLTIGTTIAVWLARKFGRKLVTRFVDATTLDKFDHLIEKGGLAVFFMIFLIPGLPDDAICFIAGLTVLPIRSIVFVSFLGRLPGLWYLSLLGDQVRSGTFDIVSMVIITSLVVFLGLLFIFHEQIENLFTSMGKGHKKSDQAEIVEAPNPDKADVHE